jgi:hypothetical protein
MSFGHGVVFSVAGRNQRLKSNPCLIFPLPALRSFNEEGCIFAAKTLSSSAYSKTSPQDGIYDAAPPRRIKPKSSKYKGL